MILKIDNLFKSFNNGKNAFQALRGVDLEVEKGEFIAIMGPSGSGKSTLLNIIAGFDNATSGDVTIAGEKITELSENSRARLRRKNIGFVFQSFCLFSDLTALENVMMPLLIEGQRKSKAKEFSLKYLEYVNLADKSSNSPEEMSGGQQQRVAIARALVSNPAIILADEPTGNLDSKSGEDILTLLKNINQNKGNTIIMVTHSEEAASYAQRRIYLKDGLIHKVVKNEEAMK